MKTSDFDGISTAWLSSCDSDLLSEPAKFGITIAWCQYAANGTIPEKTLSLFVMNSHHSFLRITRYNVYKFKLASTINKIKNEFITKFSRNRLGVRYNL